MLAIGTSVGALVAGFTTCVSFLDNRKTKQAEEKHKRDLELEAVSHENTTAEQENQKKVNESQNTQLAEHGNLLKIHAMAMKNLQDELVKTVETMESRYKQVFYGSALIHKENKNIREQMIKFSTVHQKLSEYATMITSKKE